VTPADVDLRAGCPEVTRWGVFLTTFFAGAENNQVNAYWTSQALEWLGIIGK